MIDQENVVQTSGGIYLPGGTGVPRMQVFAQSVVCRPSMAVSMFWAMQFAKLSASGAWPQNTARAFNVALNRGGKDTIAQARNHLVARAFETQGGGNHQIAYFAWQDDDVIPISEKVWKCLHHHDVDIACGTYFSREEFCNPLIFKGNGSGPDRFIPNRHYQVWGCHMGLTLVKASVYHEMARELDLGKDENGNIAYYKVGGVYETEDLYFYDNADKLGLKTVVDTSKHAFAFHHDLATGKGYPEKQWDEFITGQPIKWEAQDGAITEWNLAN